MDRRQLLTGLATLAGGGGIITGTGAFTSVAADRDVTVEVSDDADGFLQVFPSGSQENASFASNDPDTGVYFDFNGSPGGVDGTGVGQSSIYEFRDVIRVQNAGTQKVFVSLDSVTVNLTDNDGNSGDEGSVTVEFYVHETAEDPSTDLHVIDGNDADLVAPVGEQRAIGVRITTNEEDTYGDIPALTSQNGGSSSTTLKADQTASSGNTIDPGLPDPNSVTPP